jgi:outer membrane protein assembly factor BamB
VGPCAPVWTGPGSGNPLRPSGGDGSFGAERFASSPVVSDGTLYMATDQGRLFAFTRDGRATGTTP